MTADTPCLGCEYPAACDGRCAYDWVDAEITRIVAEHHNGPQRALRDREGVMRPFSEGEGGRLYQGDVLAARGRAGTGRAVVESSKMPHAPPRPCPQPGCPTLDCATHRRQPWQRTTPRRVPGGSGWAWSRQRRRILDRDSGLCRACGQPATEVDHITPMAHGGSDDDGNLVSLCKEHHAVKSARERGRGA